MSFDSMDDLVRPRPATLDRAFRGTTELTFNIIYIQVLNMTSETNPLHALVAFIFFGLVAFLQIRYPENPTPFQLHPKTTIVSIASFLVYCLAFLGRLKFATIIRINHFDNMMHIFGSLSLICLVLLLLPNTWESYGFIMYTLWFITHVFAMVRTRFREIWLKGQQIRRVVRPLLPTASMDLN